MEGPLDVDGVVDPGLLRARVVELEQELRLRMDELTRLHTELRHARADVAVKDEYIAMLTVEADKLAKIRKVIRRVPYGPRVATVLEEQLGVDPDARPTWAARTRAATLRGARRARSAAGRTKRRLLGGSISRS